MAERILPPPLRDVVERLGSADIMVGIPSHRNAATIGHVVRAAQAGLVQYFPDLRPVVVNADAGSADGTGRVAEETEPPDYIERILLVRPRNRVERISLTYPEIEGVGGKGAALRTVFQLAAALGVEALVVVDSDLRSIGPEWIELLAGPILKGGFDFVAPRYVRHKWDGTITNTVAYPLTRALYGLRIRQPIGGDFGVSGDLVRYYLAQEDWTPDISRYGIDIWMTATAIAGGYAVCEARLGAKIHDPKDPSADLGPMFSQVMGTILRLTIAHADHWLQVTGSHDVPRYGFERYADPPALAIDVPRLQESFASMATGAAAGWAAMLAPEPLAAVERLAGEAASGQGNASGQGSFTFPDEVWAQVILDVALAARRDPSAIERMVAALVPIYHGRVASLVRESRDLDAEAAEAIVERQAVAFERAKPAFAEAWAAAFRSASAAASRA